jgi:hypothetical protein
LIVEGHEEAPTTSSDISGFETDQPDKSELLARGGSRGRQTSHATNVKMANLIKVLNIRPINSPVIFIMQRHLKYSTN